MSTYSMTVAGLQRELPICKVTDDLYIGAFICFGDAELTEACGRELLKLLEPGSYDYLFTAEAKSIPLIHEMARQSGAKKYFIARKGPKAYMPDPIHVEDQSITTAGTQKLYLGRDDADMIRGKRIVLMDDVISTGESLKAVEKLVKQAGGNVVGKMAILAEGAAQDRPDILYLEKLPLFNPDGTIKQVKIQSQGETAGVGTKIENESFWSQYTGLPAETITLDQQVDRITGASISSSAVNDAVNFAIAAYNAIS